ncbi:MAG: 50S ribosome-binding GTPase, partial [Selenomonadaceae bacterium]|nr:50S ribosome-binding GTPase [Selenomonadaceae bacterium]
MSSIIESELLKCRQAAEEGYKLARDNYAEIQNTLSKAKSRVASANAEQSKVSRIQNTELIKAQEKELGNLEKSIGSIGTDLENLRKRQKDFSIVVYGRTMAGKSTLMEILTHGNGRSIGKGSQRTTRDVRDYYWNGLKITDVPGICAFEGAEDEKLAMDAAKSADLILFLLTSDAPQADEATCLAQLKKLGKPVLGLINVKMSFNINDDLDIEDLQDLMSNTSNVDAILKQFKKFAAGHNQDWSGIKFVATHLLAAYQAHPCRGNNSQVYEASKFAQVEKFILEKIKNDGRFLRIKTFVDSVAVPMNNIILKIYEQSGQSLLESDIWYDKHVQLNEWRKDFLSRSRKKLVALYDELSNILHKEIYRFSESHYEDENVNENWPRAFQ